MTDKDLARTLADDTHDRPEVVEDVTLQWLLDLDRNEPEERLFTVDLDEYVDSGLSAFEAEVAKRPMFRGKAGADDLATYVAEEIVISSETNGGNIYSSAPLAEEDESQAVDNAVEELMAVDFSTRPGPVIEQHLDIADGADILGLFEEAPDNQADDGPDECLELQPEVSAECDAVDVSAAQTSEPEFEAVYDVSMDAVLPEEAFYAEGVEQAGDVIYLGSMEVEEQGALDIPAQDTCSIVPAQTAETADFDELESAAAEAVSGFDADLFADDGGDDLFAATAAEPADIEAFFGDLEAEDAPLEAITPCPDPADQDIQAIEPSQPSVSDSEPADDNPQPAGGQDNAIAASSAGDVSWYIPESIAFNYSSPGGGEIFADFLEAFLEEGSVELEKLEDAISAWEADIHSDVAFTAVTRTLHTIKGIAKGVGLQFYGTLMHNFETLLEALPRPEAGAEPEYFRIVNVWLDAAVRGLDHVRESGQDLASEFPQVAGPAPTADPTADGTPSADERELAVEAQAATAQPLTATPQSATDFEQKRRERKERDRKLADDGARALAAQQSVRITPERLDHLLNLANQAQQLGVRTARSTASGKRTALELQARLQSVRTHLAGISDRSLLPGRSGSSARNGGMDALEMDQYSELQEVANILREGIEDLADLVNLASRHNSQVEVLLKQQSAVISSLGSSVRAARVVPVSRLMPGLRRLVRTVSNDLGKNVTFRVDNEVGTLDRDDYARCQIILEHMVRNALDHGIESPDIRQQSGKPMAGRISVDVRRAGANTVITLMDDGRGIDPQAMRETARHKGLDVDVDALSDEEALRLIFHKGFSTARSVSEISGRGVGMDIVISELQQMGGDIRIDSTLGQGTAFHITIPTNVTVNGALLVSAGHSSYAIPLGGLIAVEHVPVDAFFQAVESGGTVELSGIECQPAYLATLCQSDVLPEKKSWTGSVPVIVAGSGGRHMAIAIDHVEEALELVIRSLGPQFAAVPGVAGAATTADGEAVVALDLNLLVESMPEEGQGSLFVKPDSDDPLLVLVVDDSRTQRMVTTSQLESIGAETMTAENGAVAIDLLNTADRLPDIVLLDVEMPIKDGIETLREIRKSVRYSHVPVIMVTSRTGLKHRTLAQEAGCNGYMGKPFNFPILVGQINELTGHRLQLG